METIDYMIKLVTVVFAFVGIITVAAVVVEVFDRCMAKRGWRIKE